MNSQRFALALETHSQSERLVITDAEYKQWIFRYTFLELEKDLGKNGDLTSRQIFPDAKTVEASVIFQERGIIAGLEEIKYFLEDGPKDFRPRLGDLDVEFHVQDGEFVEGGSCILSLKGNVCDILAVERVLLNFLGRMSGVATLTNKFVLIAHSVSQKLLITATRKTLWGLLDKKAVSVGGGGTHRLNLSDAILIKDNHIAGFSESIDDLVAKAFSSSSARFVEFEVENKAQAITFAEAVRRYRASQDKSLPFCLLLDNMSPEKILSFIDHLKKDDLYSSVLLEASGGITLDNIADYAKTGVDIISCGALTQNARSLNISLEILSS